MIDARVVIDAARDPTRVNLDDDDDDDNDEVLQIQSAPPRSVSFAIAGARGVGKTAFVRRFFSECRRSARTVGQSDDDHCADDRSSWRSTPTIGMDYGAVTLAPMHARGRFYDPSGAVAHAACRAEAFRVADAVVVVVDPDVRCADDDVDDARAIEETIDEIVRAREGASDDDDDDDDARVGRGVWVAFARMRRSRPSRRDADAGDVDGRVEREKSPDARLDRVIRAVIDARRWQRRTIGDSDDVRFVVDDDFDEKDEENHPTTTTTPPTPTRPRGNNNNNNNNNSSNSFFTIDASTGLGVRRVVLALVRAIHPCIQPTNRHPRAGPHHIV